MNSFDKEDIKAIFFENYEPLKRKAFHILGNSEAAEDVIHDVFINVWKKGESLAISSPKAYFNRAVVNASLNYLEKHKNLLLIDPVVLPEGSGVNTTDDAIALNELEGNLKKALDHLSPQRRVIFSLSLFESMSNSEIAKHLGITKKTVDNQLGTALKQLRDHLTSYMNLLVEFFPLLTCLLFFS